MNKYDNDPNATVALMHSTFNLLDRFDYPKLDLNYLHPEAELALRRILDNIEEEISEVKKEIKKGNRGPELFEELTDVIVTALNIPYIIGGSEATGHLLDIAMTQVILKNDAKTHDTHELKNGKIQRK